MVVEYKDRNGSVIKKGTRVEFLSFNQPPLFGTVVDNPRESYFTPWHILLTVKWNRPKYPDISNDLESCVEINEIIAIDEAREKYSFTTSHWSRVKNRGFIAYVNETLPKGVWDPNSLVNKEVYINNERFTVTGVKKFAIGYSEEYPYSLRFGLMVK